MKFHIKVNTSSSLLKNNSFYISVCNESNQDIYMPLSTIELAKHPAAHISLKSETIYYQCRHYCKQYHQEYIKLPHGHCISNNIIIDQECDLSNLPHDIYEAIFRSNFVPCTGISYTGECGDRVFVYASMEIEL